MRRAELFMALVMATFSIYLMWKSLELPIGLVEDQSPGGGAFPFWLSAGMLVCCLVILVRWIRRTSPFSVSTQPYLEKPALRLFLITIISLTCMIGLFHIIGAYFAVPLFMIFFMRVMGKHRWRTTGALAVITPVVMFFFFEAALHITLPKGYTEPLFFPLYEAFL